MRSHRPSNVVTLRIPVREFSARRGKVAFKATCEQSAETKATCSMCGGPVRRSGRTGLLHRRCFTCRYLVMVYGPSISVTRLQPA